MNHSMLIKGLFFLMSISTTVAAQEISLSEVESSSLEDLLNMETTVTSKVSTSARSAPGAVSIITDSDIRNMGAIDLIDVLRTIPSINFGTDVQGVVGLGIRGMWAHEGKFLLIIDGIEMNEIQYGTTQFGRRYPVDQIKRIEIIRGPGSVIYGGFAELAVINITTKSGADLKGASVQATYGQMAKGSEYENLSASVGNSKEKIEYSFATSSSKAKRGEGTYTGTDLTNTGSFRLDDDLNPRYVNAGLSIDKLKLRFIYDEYETTTRSWYGHQNANQNVDNNFRSMNFAASYSTKVLEGITFSPYLHYYMQSPWNLASEAARDLVKWWDVDSTRLKTGFTGNKDITSNINILAGYEFLRDRNSIERMTDNTGADLQFNSGGTKFDLYSHALLAQALIKMSHFDLTLGARYEDPSRTKSSFVPRVALTKETKTWHSKLLWSNSFRSPALYNLDLRPTIKPEQTQTAEVEVGVATGVKSYITANLYYTKVKDPIVYFFTTSDQYDNFHSVATKGLELSWQYRESWADSKLGYAYYQVDTNKVSKYATSDDNALLGMPQHQLVASSSIHLPKTMKLSPTLVYHGEQHAYETGTGNTNVERTLPATVWASLYLSKENLLVRGLSGGIGVNNLFNNDIRYVQPYGSTTESGHSPLPGPSREAFGRIEYQASF